MLPETDPKIQRTNYVWLPGMEGRGVGDGQIGLRGVGHTGFQFME